MVMRETYSITMLESEIEVFDVKLEVGQDQLISLVSLQNRRLRR